MCVVTVSESFVSSVHLHCYGGGRLTADMDACMHSVTNTDLDVVTSESLLRTVLVSMYARRATF